MAAPSLPPAVARYRRLWLESVLIVLSVLLGFALTEWREARAERELAAAALASFRREIEGNLAELRRVHPKHVALRERLARVADTATTGTAFEVFLEVFPESGLDNPILAEAAWETAVSTGALRLLDYDTAALLSNTYLIQRLSIQATVARMGDRIMDVPNFDPASRSAMLRVHHMLLIELTGQETFLMETYEDALKRLPAPPG